MLENVLKIVGGLAGLGGFISVVVNLLKKVGVVKDGTADRWFEAINLGAFVVVAGVYVWQVDVDWTQIDAWLQALASLLGLVVQIIGGRATYDVLRGVPFAGFSFTKKAERDAADAIEAIEDTEVDSE